MRKILWVAVAAIYLVLLFRRKALALRITGQNPLGCRRGKLSLRDAQSAGAKHLKINKKKFVSEQEQRDEAISFPNKDCLAPNESLAITSAVRFADRRLAVGKEREAVMDLGLTGKVALVTGGSKGIGKAIAEEFAKEGAHVSICARGQRDLATAAEELRKHGVTVIATQADVTKAEDIQHVIDATLTQCGRIDILINNAGSAWLGHSVETSDEQWQYALDINLQSAVRFTRGVVPAMRRVGGGRIINISTAGARTVLAPGMLDYTAAKAALLAFSRAAAAELAPDNILVNAVCPGFIHSPLHDSLSDSAMALMGFPNREEVDRFLHQFILTKRIGKPEEVAPLVVFLASAQASYITGSIYDVDGGYTKSVI
jgi:3-oxoacyl-[acyl-carrier protein] reductase